MQEEGKLEGELVAAPSKKKPETVKVESKGLWQSILEVQKKVSVLSTDEANPFYKSQYLSLAGLIKSLQPHLSANNLVVTQHPSDEGSVKTMVVYAPTGEAIESTLKLPVKESTPQSAGSSITYARRYALMAIFNIAAEDDDGNSGSSNSSPSQRQIYLTSGTTVIQKCPVCGREHTGKYPKCIDCYKESSQTKTLINEDMPPFDESMQ